MYAKEILSGKNGGVEWFYFHNMSFSKLFLYGYHLKKQSAHWKSSEAHPRKVQRLKYSTERLSLITKFTRIKEKKVVVHVISVLIFIFRISNERKSICSETMLNRFNKHNFESGEICILSLRKYLGN